MATGAIRKIQRASGVRYEVVNDRGIDPITGKRKQESKTFKTKKEAEAYARTRQTEIDRGTAVDHSNMTTGEYLKHWLETAARPKVRQATYSGYERLIRVQLIPRIGSVPLQKLTALHIQACYTAMRADGARADNKEGTLSARSIRYAHTVLKMALKQAVRWRMVPLNVAADVDPPKATRPQIQVWDADEARRFLALAAGDRYALFWRLALDTGMRKGELLGLRWCDVDLARGVVHVRQQVTWVGGQIVTGEPKTKSGRRSIALPPGAVAQLRAHREARDQEPIPLDAAQRDADLVFPGVAGRPLDPSALYDHFGRLVRQAGLPAITIHGLRHTHATLLLLAGVNVKVVSARLGHSSIQITLDTYAHLLPEMEERAAEAIGAILHAV